MPNPNVNYPRGSRPRPPAPNKTYDNGAAADFELAVTPDAKVIRRNKQIEATQQEGYFNRLNFCLDPEARVQGFLRALPAYPGADMIYHIPNANVAGEAVGKKLVAQGLRAGYPDINVDVARVCNGHRYHGLRIELKQPQGVPSDVEVRQADWHTRLRDQGYKVAVCFGMHEAWRVTCEYLGWENQ